MLTLTPARPRAWPLAALGTLLCISLLSTGAFGQISLTAIGTPYSQNFDSLVASGTSSAVPAGWAFSEAGTNANATYTAGTGSSTTGDTYSLGAAAATDRAFGGLLSGTLIPTIGAAFTNNTNNVINTLAIAYTGEQWHLGAARRVDRLDFQYSLDATSLTTGRWTDVDPLDFTAPVTVATVGALDGNAAANRSLVSSSIGSLAIPNGATFWIRWNDFDATGSDDALGVDSFSITPGAAIATDLTSFGAVKELYQ